MPIHRAYYATSTEAREAASVAVDALNAKWRAATLAAGALTESTTPVVGVRFDESTEFPPLAECAAALVDTRITAPDGRTEVAKLAMVTTEADALLTPAYGVAAVGGTVSAKIQARGRVAKSVQVYVTGVGAVAFAAHVVQDRLTGKKYTTATVNLGPGVITLDVTEADSADLNDVTFGSVLEFVAPPAGVDPIVRVNKMLAFTVPDTATLTDSTGRIWTVPISTAQTDSAVALSGDHTLTVSVRRSTTDGLAIDSSAQVGDVLTFVAQPTATAETATVTVSSEVTVPNGSACTYGGRGYTSVGDTVIYDTLAGALSFVADDVGANSNIPVGATLTLTSPPSGVTAGMSVSSTVAAAVLPQRYTAQIVGAPVTWTSRVDRAADGRWRAVVFTLPEGS